MTKQFTIIVTEVREKSIVINADTPDEALDLVEGLYSLGDIKLTNDDFEDVDFEVQENV